MIPILFSIGSFKLHAFGALVAAGFIAAMGFVTREADRVGENRNLYLDLVLVALVSGLLGCRALFVAVTWELFEDDPIRALYIWQGGLVWYGGLIAGFAACITFLRSRGRDALLAADHVAPGIMLGLAVGRIGCWAVGDDHGSLVVSATGPIGLELFQSGSLFDATGRVLDSARHAILTQNLEWPWWTTVLGPGSLVQDDLAGLPLYPTQIAMGAYAFGIYLFLEALKTKHAFRGQIISAMGIVYSICRFILEYYRGDIGRGMYFDGMFSTSQVISLAILAFSLWSYFRLRSAGRNSPLEIVYSSEAKAASA